MALDLIVPSASLTQLPFTVACEEWLKSRRPYLSPKTHHEYSLNIKTLAKFFANFRLPEIDGDLIRAYQRARRTKCGPFAINNECGLICQVRKRIGMPIEDYQPLPEPKAERGRALTDAERLRLLRIAESSPHWQAAYLFAGISVNTTAGPKEVATLRLKDVDLEREQIHVQPEGAKNIHRPRAIPLNSESLRCVKIAIERAKSLGAVQPEHYLFPFRINRALYDPNRHQTSFKKAWKRIIEAAHIPGLRMYDLRHHAITSMLENPDISEETVEDICGHVSRKMKKRYSHIRMEYKRAAVAAIGSKPRSFAHKKPPKSEKCTDRTQLAAKLAAVFAEMLAHQ